MCTGKVKLQILLLKQVVRNRNVLVRSRRSISTRTEGVSPTEYCASIVKQYDYENYLSTLLLPTEARTSMFAVRAFNVELAQINDAVSDPEIGKMRVLFWENSLKLVCKNEPPQSPVTVALAKAVQKHQLNSVWLKRLIHSRSDFSHKPFSTMQQLEHYAESSVSSIIYLTLQCLGVQNVDADHVASHVGKAQGIATLLRAVPYHAQRSQCYLPTKVMVQHLVAQEDILRGRDEQKVRDAVFDIASVANQHVETARSLKDKVPKSARPAFLPLAACEHYLKTLQKVDFNVFHGQLPQRHHLLPLRLLLHKMRGTY